jgi:hypothetical protein
MKNKYVLLLLLIFCGFTAEAQNINNPGFEDWQLQGNDSVADHWHYISFQNHLTTDSRSGKFAMVTHHWYTEVAGYLVNGPKASNYSITFVDNGNGEPIATKPVALTGFYKFIKVPTNDTAAMGLVILKRYNAQTGKREIIGSGYTKLPPANNYTAFTISINDLQPGSMPDSIIVYFKTQSGHSNSYCDGGSGGPYCAFLYIDDLELVENSGINVHKTANDLLHLFPNPVTQGNSLSVSIPFVEEKLTFQITNSLGQVVFQDEQPGNAIGLYDTYRLDTHLLKPNVYFLKVITKGQASLNQKFIVQ